MPHHSIWEPSAVRGQALSAITPDRLLKPIANLPSELRSNGRWISVDADLARGWPRSGWVPRNIYAEFPKVFGPQPAAPAVYMCPPAPQRVYTPSTPQPGPPFARPIYDAQGFPPSSFPPRAYPTQAHPPPQARGPLPQADPAHSLYRSHDHSPAYYTTTHVSTTSYRVHEQQMYQCDQCPEWFAEEHILYAHRCIVHRDREPVADSRPPSQASSPMSRYEREAWKAA
ncbi:hypothetical protein BV25DRAFT_1839584 [Artomyces pyxidatus]|uniref:Uncharacterized protein n=1 Tax=Artomyces pyxidatus TaxID=48021 RepID=A0ACB8SX53_9AGAM|nr:hypothetical protein BV25DRAFT_1839584 [Artomyces pyxidatus]